MIRLPFTWSFALLLALTPPALAEGTVTYLGWNMPAEEQACPVGDDAVWVEYSAGDDCIRYFAGGELDDAPLVIVRLYGDRTSYMGRNAEDIPGNTADAQQAYAERRADELGMPVVVIARPGTYGSSGDHRRRRQVEEFLALNAALDEVVRRHRIGRVILSGHSGGATAAAALLTFGRSDVACAVLTSGAYGLLERAHMLRERNDREQRPGVDLTGFADPYDPLDHIDGILHDPGRTILVIGNEDDQVTPFILQQRFAEAVAAAGHNVQLMTHPAQAPKHHDLTSSIGITAAARCAVREE